MSNNSLQFRRSKFSRDRIEVSLAVYGHGLLMMLALAGCDNSNAPSQKSQAPAETIRPDEHGVYHVYPGNSIQQALNAAAANPDAKTVRVHAGTYFPSKRGQAYLRLTGRHDGILLEAAGKVVLTACNPGPDGRNHTQDDITVNHVVYFGDGIGSETVLRGFHLTGARNALLPTSAEPPLEPRSAEPGLAPGLFFYLDGGAIKIFGRSSPAIENTVVEDNQTELCGGGVSIEHRGLHDEPVRFTSCIFRNNRCPATGSAVDVLEGSSAKFDNCLFVGNVGNYGMDRIRLEYGLTYNAEHGSGALTVFPNSRVSVIRSTFTGNWNGVDDHGEGSTYRTSIFWKNTASDGSRPGDAYEVDIIDASRFTNCWIGGGFPDLRGTIDGSQNRLAAPDPDFDDAYRPRQAGTEDLGYRPFGDALNSTPNAESR